MEALKREVVTPGSHLCQRMAKGYGMWTPEEHHKSSQSRIHYVPPHLAVRRGPEI